MNVYNRRRVAAIAAQLMVKQIFNGIKGTPLAGAFAHGFERGYKNAVQRTQETAVRR